MKTGKHKKGISQKLWKCPREIRIQMPSKIGQIYEGYNEQLEVNQKWMLIKTSKDYNNNIMQLILE